MNGMPLQTNNEPSTAPCVVSCLGVWYPGSLGVRCRGESLVSWMSATSKLCLCMKCLSGWILVVMSLIYS